jgi:hypothetical protein
LLDVDSRFSFWATFIIQPVHHHHESMSWRKSEEELSWSHLVIVIAIAIGAWLLYRQYDAAAKRMQRRQDIPFGELRIVKEGEDPKFQ